MAMTAKEKLRERVEALTEEEAAEALRLLDQRTEDPVIAAFRDAPIDDEPVTPEEEAAIQIAREEIARGETISLEEFRTELDAGSR
jgi:hypothetical protein